MFYILINYSQNDNTLLMVAAYKKGLTEVVAILLTYGADVNLQNKV